MLESLKKLFRPDDVIASLSVFPEIDDAKIANELDLEGVGRARGSQSQPAQGATTADHVETAVRARIESLRRNGLERYEGNRTIYNERLARAGQARKEVDIVAGDTRADFLAEVKIRKAKMTSSIERLKESYDYRVSFRRKYNLDRPARQFEGWFRFILVAVIFIVIECFLNAYLFSGMNEQGLLGGLFQALIISLVNVVGSVMLGFFACGLNHTHPIRKLGGLVALVLWFALAVALNLAVAHFRDLLEGSVAWRDALTLAVVNVKANPLGLASLESWVLFAIGFMISALSFLKGWHAHDPFPGYAAVEKALDDARLTYEADLVDAIDELSEKRREAIDKLKDADQQVRDGISSAIDALFGRTALDAHLQAFLEQCDMKLAHLLAIYRDANRAARPLPEPASFSQTLGFTPFAPTQIEISRKHGAEAEVERVSATVDAAIREIFQTFTEAVEAFHQLEEVQRGRHLTQEAA
ncbi:MAG: phage holin family protein [Rhodobacterales bacterium]|nr:phage holin family protein [Rhodobacterales bacterium]